MPSTAPNRPRTGHSLHIGVNRLDPGHYRGWLGALSSCENDVDTLMGIARSRGFKTRALKTEDATRDNVIGAIRQAASTLDRGDIFLISYAGHGSRLIDRNGDEADGKDDTWCLYDGQLIDDELNVLFAGFAPGVRVLVLSDSCHSGTLLDSGGPAVSAAASVEPERGAAEDDAADDFDVPRLMPRVAAEEVSRAYWRFYRDIQNALPEPRPEIRASIRLLSGCQETERSYGNKQAGRFTAAVKDVFDNGRFNGNYAQFHAQIVKQVARAKKPQTPAHRIRGPLDARFEAEAPFTI